MNKQDQLEELLVDWELQRQQGAELSAVELCKDCPELAPEMEKLVRDFKATDWLEEEDDSNEDILPLPNFSTMTGKADETWFPDCALSVDEYCERLIASELIDVEQVEALQERLAPQDTRSFARQLVEEKKLTRFQAIVLLEGQDVPLVLDRYVLLEEIGAGGMGTVYKALHQQMDRVVALKILPKKAVDSDDKVKRFQREVKAAAKLEHPNIVTTHDASEDKGYHFLVMSLVNGSDLAKTVQLHGVLSAAKAVNYITQAARGLEHAHSMGIIHRDIKPANLLLNKNGRVKILDMGLARMETADAEYDKTVSQDLTRAGMVMGTAAYLAPEQALDTHHADARSDIYSLGCTLHYLLTGKTMYAEETMMRTIMAHLQSSIPSLCEEKEAVPAEIDAVFQKMVAKQPEDRYQSMSDVISALEELDIEDVEQAQPIAATEGPAMQDTATSFDTSRDVMEPVAAGSARPPKRHWGWTAGGVFGFVVLLTGLIIKLITPAGAVILEIDQPELIGAVVTIDGEKKITIKTGKGKQPIEITPDEKRHELEVKMAGFHTLTKAFSFETGNKQTIKVRLDPLGAEQPIQPVMSSSPDGIGDRQYFSAIRDLGGRVVFYLRPEYLQDADKVTQASEERGNAHILIAPKNLSDTPDLMLAPQVYLAFEGEQFDEDDFSRVVELIRQRPEGALPTSLQLIKNSVRARSLKQLTGIQLVNLEMNGVAFAKETLTILRDLDVCGTLGLNRARLTDASLSTLVQYPMMQNVPSLAVTQNDISDKGLSYLENLRHLVRLQVAGTRVTVQGIERFHQAVPGCKILWDGGTVEPKADSTSNNRTDSSDLLGGREYFTALHRLGSRIHIHYASNVITPAMEDAVERIGDDVVSLVSPEKLGDGNALLMHPSIYVVFSGEQFDDDKLKQVGKLLRQRPTLAPEVNLYLRYTSVTSEGLFALEDIPFGTLSLVGVTATPPAVTTLARCRPSHCLIIRDAALDDEGLRRLVQGSEFNWLHVERNRITGAGLRGVVGSNVTVLGLGSNDLQDDDLAPLVDHSELTSITLNGNPISDQGLGHLESLPLADLRLEQTDVTAEGVNKLRRVLPECQISWDGGKVFPSTNYNWPEDQPAPAIAPFAPEEAKEHQAEWAEHLGVPVEMENSIGMKFRLIPPGEFLMGSSDEEIEELVSEAHEGGLSEGHIGRISAEGPQHRVTLTRPATMSLCEVTRGQFRQFVDAAGYQTEAERDGQGGFGMIDGEWTQAPQFLWNTNLGFEIEQTDDHPVVNVSWNDAVAFCEWLTKKEGLQYRLPTEAEWEFACRAGNQGRFCFGDDESEMGNYAWYANHGGRQTKPVGRKEANAFGLFDLHGNVREWCMDEMTSYATGPVIDPLVSGERDRRVLRGGPFYSTASYNRSACRYSDQPNSRWNQYGFRIVHTFDQ